MGRQGEDNRAMVCIVVEEYYSPQLHNLRSTIQEDEEGGSSSPSPLTGATPASTVNGTWFLRNNNDNDNNSSSRMSPFLSLPNNSSRWSTGSKHPLCRICLEPEPVESLFSPCKCSGSLAFVHHGCLGRWLASKPARNCEICKVPLPVRYRSRTASEFFAERICDQDRPYLTIDVTCFSIITPLALACVWLCGFGASYYSASTSVEGGRHRFEVLGLIALGLFLLVSYVLWLFITVRFQRKEFKEWQEANQEVELLEMGLFRGPKENGLPPPLPNQQEDPGAPLPNTQTAAAASSPINDRRPENGPC